jgi:hypothetical protein
MSQRQIKISGLSEGDVELLDIIYSMSDYEELMEWVDTLSVKLRRRVQCLIKLILLETIEEEMIRPMTSYPDAERIIEHIKRTYNP